MIVGNFHQGKIIKILKKEARDKRDGRTYCCGEEDVGEKEGEFFFLGGGSVI